MSETKKSVMNCVKEFATANRTFTIDDVCKAYPDKSKTQISTALWKLRGAGIVAKHEDGMYTVLTDVNKPVGVPKVVKKAKAPAKSPYTVAELSKKLKEANEEVSYWNKQYLELAHKGAVTNEQWLNLRQQHEDALAIIRYLENKLYVALQQVAKNGSNA